MRTSCHHELGNPKSGRGGVARQDGRWRDVKQWNVQRAHPNDVNVLDHANTMGRRVDVWLHVRDDGRRLLS